MVVLLPGRITRSGSHQVDHRAARTGDRHAWLACQRIEIIEVGNVRHLHDCDIQHVGRGRMWRGNVQSD